MIKRFLLGAIFASIIAPVAQADVDREVADIRALVDDCVAKSRDVCVVFGATQMLTNVDMLNHFYTEDTAGLEQFVNTFERASFRIALEGRPDFRKFLAENAIWTMDYYNERFLARVDPEYIYEDVRHFYAAYQLARAAACDEADNAPCTESALWYVKNAQDKNYWDRVVDRFQILPEQSDLLLGALFEQYEGRYE
ncbi:MAG: hypothetical protein AAF429_06685 [Pseudomonadota bacterium]